MSERLKIEGRLRKKEQELQGLEEKLKATRIYIQALQDVLNLLDHEPDPGTATETILKPGSAVARAREVILERGRSVHVSELLGALGKEATREGRASLTSSLAAYVRRGEIFTRPAPNTFGLIESGHHATEPAADEPPVGFGEVGEARVPSSASVSAAKEDDDIPF